MSEEMFITPPLTIWEFIQDYWDFKFDFSWWKFKQTRFQDKVLDTDIWIWIFELVKNLQRKSNRKEKQLVAKSEKLQSITEQYKLMEAKNHRRKSESNYDKRTILLYRKILEKLCIDE